MKASILAHGILQNLVVTAAKKGRFHVIAGVCRLEALKALIAEGKLPEDHAVTCQIVHEKDAIEMSLAENTVRTAMHPADEFEAFAALIDAGQIAAQVAERFGVTEAATSSSGSSWPASRRNCWPSTGKGRSSWKR